MFTIVGSYLVRPRNLVFLCVQNSARSQMAEALARDVVPASIQVWSAGSQPYKVRPQVPTVLAELGIDCSEQRSKGMDEVPLDESSLVITLCAEQICPVIPGASILHWPIADPAVVGCSEEERLQRFREARDEIRARLQALLAQMA